jgi:hypothetical protein
MNSASHIETLVFIEPVGVAKFGGASYDAGIAAPNIWIRLSGEYQRLKFRMSWPLRTHPGLLAINPAE